LKLQRLFSTFPGGLPGAGLLLLRATVGVAAVTQGGLYLVDRAGSALEIWTIGLTLAGSGAVVLVGLLTPLASAVVALMNMAIAVSWLPPPVGNLFNTPLPLAFEVSIATALGLLGPGALSVDCHLFGRREIVIPQTRQLPKL
jgi:hypothetical protein